MDSDVISNGFCWNRRVVRPKSVKKAAKFQFSADADQQNRKLQVKFDPKSQYCSLSLKLFHHQHVRASVFVAP
jgi:hypothetical protein